MKKSHWIKILFGVGIILAIVVGCGSDNNTPTPATPDEAGAGKTKSFLFVQNAASGTFVGDGNGSYTLALNGVSPQTIYFSDRPVRDAGQVAMQEFLASGCFNSSNPPNVAIDVLGAGEGNDVVIVELTNPIYNANSATLQYTARILKDGNFTVESLNTRRDASIPESFGAVALFIDDCSDARISCGDKDGHRAGEMSCCTCWKFGHGCDFQKDCCSFERCQHNCTKKYGSENKYIYTCEPYGWVDNYDDWENARGACSITTSK
jgi:hypothetical protein